MRPIRLSAAAVICLLAAGCRPVSGTDVRQLVPELTMEGVHFSIERGGLRRAQGESDRLTYRRDTTAVSAEGLSMVMTGSEGQLKVTAPRGAGVAADRRFDLEGGVQAIRGTDVLSTPTASYQAPQGGPGLVTGADPVTVTGPGYRLSGVGFRLSPASGEIVLGGGARLVAGLPVTP